MKRFRRHPFVQWPVYAAMRVIIVVVAFVSFFVTRRRVGSVLGRALHFIDRKHRRRARMNIEASQPPVCPPDEINQLIRRVYEHLGLVFVEILLLPGEIARGMINDRVAIHGFEKFYAERSRDRGMIVVVAHLGNWEVGGVAVSIAGYPLNSLARPIENPWIDRYLNRFRTSKGQTVIPKYDALRTMISVLKKKEMLVIQADQDVRHSGMLPEFFGRPASTIRSPALLSIRYNVPIAPVEIYREVDGTHVVRCHELIDPAEFRGRQDAMEAITQAYTSKLEEFVRRHPEQWFWLHHRWKTADRNRRKFEKQTRV